jgi:hypothetical protein
VDRVSDLPKRRGRERKYYLPDEMSLWLLLFIACPDHEIALTPSYTEQHSIIESLVTQILTLKRSDPTADTSALEAEVDGLVYGLYGLTEAEVAFVVGRG